MAHWKWREEKLQNEERTFFFFCFSLFKTTEICFGFTKMGIFYLEKTSLPLWKIFLLRPCRYFNNFITWQHVVHRTSASHSAVRFIPTSKISQIWCIVGLKRDRIHAKCIPWCINSVPFQSHNASNLWYFAFSNEPYWPKLHPRLATSNVAEWLSCARWSQQFVNELVLPIHCKPFSTSVWRIIVASTVNQLDNI